MFGKTRNRHAAGIEPVEAGGFEIVQAAIVHLDIVGSTQLVRRDLRLAHLQVSRLYQRICRVCRAHGGQARELRGDAAVLEFASVDDALRATRAIHATAAVLDATRVGRINPRLRTGVSFGEIISESRLITGAAVIRAQRIEQLAEPGQVWFDDTVYPRLDPAQQLGVEAMPARTLKGFAGETALYRIRSTCREHPSRWQELFRPLVA